VPSSFNASAIARSVDAPFRCLSWITGNTSPRYFAALSYAAPDDWVFASESSFGKQPLWPGTLWRRNVAPAIDRAEVVKPKLGWHTLRRSYASLLFSSGASLRVSMELMRHSTAEMTLATYAQTVGNEKRDAGSKVALLVLEGGRAA
jgi:integrase